MSKLNYEERINIYNEREQGISISTLSKKYNVRKNVIQYMVCLIDKHGIDILRKNKKIRGRKFIFKGGTRILKKIESRCSSKEESTTEEKVNVVSELRLTYPLMILLQVSGLAKSVYYYTLSKTDKDDKNKKIIEKIKEIFINNKERYGYRRITL